METTPKSRIYRTEAFITLKKNCDVNLDISVNEIDDVKFANKLKISTLKVKETEDQDKKIINKSSDIENVSSSTVDAKSHESAESLNTTDSSKKASINSFNEYQEEPDLEILIKSPELLESYSNELERDNASSPLNGTIPGIKKCLADFMEEKSKIEEEAFRTEKTEIEDGENITLNDNFKQSTIKDNLVNKTEGDEKIVEIEENEAQGRRVYTEEKKAEEKGEIRENKFEKQVQENRETPLNKSTDSHKLLSKSDQPIYDEPFVGNLHKNSRCSKPKLDIEYVQTALSNIKTRRFSSRHPKRCNSLKSIDEGVEIVDSNFDDVCYHGHKNGCTVAAQKPEDVSQEVFRDNWMQRLESLRQKEALLKDKDIALQSRERLLFKKEKELRILERMIKDKMKQAELYLKRCKNSQSLENVFDEKYVDSKSSDGSGASKTGLVLNVASTAKRVPFVGDSLWLQAPELKYDLTKDKLKSLPPSRTSYATLPSDAKYGSKLSAYSSFRCRPKPKISHDDLDSTLSADVGDSSLVVTSRKFDPVVFKKPTAFKRSASERRPKMERNIISKEQHTKEESPEFEESKIFRKVSENILASQDKETIFLNYGIIDNKAKTLDRHSTKSEEEKKCGYLNLEVADHKVKKKSSKGLKSRPVSWSAETDHWLQKKREAFNSANQKCVNSCDKENLELKPKTVNHSTVKKKSWKAKKFSIFR